MFAMFGVEHGAMAWAWPGMSPMWVVPIFLAALVLLALIAGRTGQPRLSAREVLDLRYAKGEIGRGEWLRSREDLQGPAASRAAAEIGAAHNSGG